VDSIRIHDENEFNKAIEKNRKSGIDLTIVPTPSVGPLPPFFHNFNIRFFYLTSSYKVPLLAKYIFENSST
jgi:hypothetical protein